MSFTREYREQIKLYLLEKISAGDTDFIKKTCSAFSVSDKTVYRYIKELTDHGYLKRTGRSYRLAETGETFLLPLKEAADSGEDRIYQRYVYKYIEKLPENVRGIWNYTFTEMLNNAIDHSQAGLVMIVVSQNYLNTSILIHDNGIGIFRKIKNYFHFQTLDDAITELFKGKLTTDEKHHSGEGIFFTSRLLDLFAAISDGKIFTHDRLSGWLQDLEELSSLHQIPAEGTTIFMRLSNFSNKNTTDIFDLFADVDGGFFRTQIPLNKIYDTYPVSRSQAKRLCRRFERFQEVDLDFEGVSNVGQGFVHELFVVYGKSHPGTKLTISNANDTVRRMIAHVTSL